MLLTADAYQAFTGQAAPDNYETVESATVALFEQLLDRPLRQKERTTQVECWEAELYPPATPIVAVAAAATRTGTTPEAWADLPVIEWDDISVTVAARNRDRVRLTYTGGYTPYGSDGPEPLPADLAEALAWAIHTRTTSTSAAPEGAEAGVRSMSVANEFSITYADGTVAGADGVALFDGTDPRWAPLGGRAARLAAGHRHVRVA